VTILFLISSEGYYGVENMLVSLAQQLDQQGCRTVVGVFRNSQNPHVEVAEQAERQGIAVEIISCNGRWDWNVVSQIRCLVKKHDVDVLHPHGYKADLYAWAAAAGNRVALVATSHNWPSKALSMRTYAVVDRLALRSFDRVVVVSDAVAQILLRSGVANEKVELIPNGVDLGRFRDVTPALRTELETGTEPVIGFVGRLVAEKGGVTLLQAAQRVLTKRPKAKFVLVGEGPARQEWEALARELGIDQQVTFTGARNDMPEVYASFDAMVLPSEIEALPMCLLEAMAAGKPVIATRVGAIPRLIMNGTTGLLIEPGDVNALTKAILRLLEDRDFASRLGEKGRDRVAQHFSAQQMAKNYIGTYEQVLANRGDRTRKVPAFELN
jgi:glycosyltransferase involved in cell wall biosynthesis